MNYVATHNLTVHVTRVVDMDDGHPHVLSTPDRRRRDVDLFPEVTVSVVGLGGAVPYSLLNTHEELPHGQLAMRVIHHQQIDSISRLAVRLAVQLLKQTNRWYDGREYTPSSHLLR